MIKRLAIDGIDGCGKTTVATELVAQLSAEGVHAVSFSPYRLANDALGEDIYSLWPSRAGARKAITALKAATETCVELAVQDAAGVLIYDRHWMTVFTEIGDRPDLIDFWGDCFVPTALLLAAPLVASRRLTNDRNAPWNTVRRQADYDLRFREIARQLPARILGQYRTDSDVMPEAIARSINWDMHILR